MRGTLFLLMFPLALVGAICRGLWICFSIGWSMPEHVAQKNAEAVLAALIASNIALKKQSKGYQGPIDLGGGGLN